MKESTLSAHCPVCGSIAAKPSAKLDNGYTLVQCLQCELLFANPRPTIEQLKAVYEPPPAGVFADHTLDETKGIGIQYEALLRRSGGTGNKVLEIGCNTGFALHGLQQLGYDVSGTDLSETAIQFGKERYNLQQLYCSEFPPPKYMGTFDVVIASHIIEHVVSPKDFVAQCARFLKKGGLYIIRTPNARSLGIRLLKTHYPVFCPPIHLNYFSQATLSSLLHGPFALMRSEIDSDWRDKRNTVYNLLVSITHQLRIKDRLKDHRAFGENTAAGNGNARSANALDVVRRSTQFTQRMLWPVFSVLDKTGLGENMTVVARKL